MEELLRKIMWLPPQASEFAVGLDRLNIVIFVTTVLSAVVIGAVALYLSLKYRRQPNSPTVTPHVEVPHIAEAAFFIFPLIIFLAWFVVGFAQFKDMTRPPADAIDVFVMGKKWMWKFAYPQGPSGVNILRVPVNRPVRLLMTSRDVLHSFYIPAFRIKQDVLPSKYTQTWFKATKVGEYHIFCAEYCGTDHSRMGGTVIVMEEEAWDKWMKEQMRSSTQQADTDPSKAAYETSMVDQGRRLASQYGCFKCHSITGERHLGPTFSGLYHRLSMFTDGTSQVVDEAYMTESMMDPNRKIVATFPAGLMPSFQGVVAPLEAAAIVEFIKSLPAPPTSMPVQGGTP